LQDHFLFIFFVELYSAKLTQQSFKGVKVNYEKNAIPDHPSSRFTGSDLRVRDDSMNNAHVAIAVEGPGYSNPDFIAMEIASSVSLLAYFI